MSTIKHTLTETEIACGVTLQQVQEVLPKALVNNDRVIVPADVAPALGSSVARCIFGKPAEYAGHNQLGLPVYRPQEESQEDSQADGVR